MAQRLARLPAARVLASPSRFECLFNSSGFSVMAHRAATLKGGNAENSGLGYPPDLYMDVGSGGMGVQLLLLSSHKGCNHINFLMCVWGAWGWGWRYRSCFSVYQNLAGQRRTWAALVNLQLSTYSSVVPPPSVSPSSSRRLNAIFIQPD